MEHYPTTRSSDVKSAASLDARFRKLLREDTAVSELISTVPELVAQAMPASVESDVPLGQGGCVKIIHIIRHGNGVHNVMVDSWTELKKLGGSYHVGAQALFGLNADRDAPSGPVFAPLIDALRDAPLTEAGRAEARETRKEAESKAVAPRLLVVSPMRRAAETGLIIFPEVGRVVAHDSLHECSGLYSWDRRRDLTDLKADATLTRVDWSGVTHETCPWWGEAARESDLAMTRRLVDFMKWLKEQPEEEIAIASHSHIIYVLLLCGLLRIPPESVTDNGMPADSWFITGEMRSYRLVWKNGKRKREE